MSRKNRFIRVGSRALFSARRGAARNRVVVVAGQKRGEKKRRKETWRGNGGIGRWKISSECVLGYYTRSSSVEQTETAEEGLVPRALIGCNGPLSRQRWVLICTPMYTSYTSFAIDNSLHFSRTNRYFVDREKFKINMDFVSMWIFFPRVRERKKGIIFLLLLIRHRSVVVSARTRKITHSILKLLLKFDYQMVSFFFFARINVH